MPSIEKRVNLTLDRAMVQALEHYMQRRGVHGYATSAYWLLRDALVRTGDYPPRE